MATLAMAWPLRSREDRRVTANGGMGIKHKRVKGRLRGEGLQLLQCYERRKRLYHKDNLLIRCNLIIKTIFERLILCATKSKIAEAMKY